MSGALVVFLLVAVASVGQGVPVADPPAGCTGQPNTHPIADASDMVLVNNITNAKLFRMTTGNASLDILHLYGTPYQMGFAQGTLLKERIIECYEKFFDYLDAFVDPYIKFLPKILRDMIEDAGAFVALEAEVEWTHKYTPEHFFQEMHGIADATGVEYGRVLRVHMFPELIKASCSMFGAWDPAISSGLLTQLRALDWGLDNSLVDFPLTVVYHPNAGDGHEFASLTWAGFIGTVTAYSNHVGLSEKVWLSYNESGTREGVPFHFLMRDVAQYDENLDQAVDRMNSTSRTCSVFLGIGSKADGQFRVVQYSHEELFVWSDTTYPVYPEHPRMPGVVYVDKHMQPSHHTCFPGLLKEYYGHLNSTNAIRNIASLEESGDMHAAVYDYGRNTMFVSVARRDADGVAHPAHEEPWFELNMDTHFNL